MIPGHYVCTSCGEKFSFAHLDAVYYFDSAPPGNQLTYADLFHVPVRPGWCKTCATVCLVEDIAPLRAFEDAYSAVRSGRQVEYPLETLHLSPQQAHEEVSAYLRWRLGRRHAPRALCCGGTNYQFLDVAQPLFKHAGCDFGVVEPGASFIGSYNSPGPGVISRANIPVYDGEGLLTGLLTWQNRDTEIWEVVPMAYPPADED